MKRKLLIAFLILSNISLLTIVIYPYFEPEIPTKPKINWHKRMYENSYKMQEMYSGQADIVMLGNSITHRCEWHELLGRTDIINRGIEGERSHQAINRLGAIIALKPKKCFLLIGINDIKDGKSANEVAKNVKTISIKLREANIEVIIQSVLYVHGGYPRSNASITKLNKNLKSFCDENEIDYLDLNSAMGNDGFLSNENSFDGIHITPKAYEKWGVVLKDYLAKADSISDSNSPQ